MSSSELIADWLFGTGFISLAPTRLPVEEQPVVRTTVAPSATASNAARSRMDGRTRLDGVNETTETIKLSFNRGSARVRDFASRRCLVLFGICAASTCLREFILISGSSRFSHSEGQHLLLGSPSDDDSQVEPLFPCLCIV